MSHERCLTAFDMTRRPGKKERFAETSPQAYLPDVAMTLNNLAIFYMNDVSNKELSLKYALEAVEVLGKCKDIPVVRKYLQQAKQIIEQWDK